MHYQASKDTHTHNRNADCAPQVITSADFHPESCSIFAFSSSKGCIRLADMRESALCDGHSKAFEETEPQVRCRLPKMLSSGRLQHGC